MKNLFTGLNLVQKVTVTMIVLFVITSIGMALVISQVIRQSYLNEQKRSVSQFVLKQATQYLTAADLQKTDLRETQPKFDAFRTTISTPAVSDVTIFNTGGKVLSSDDPALIGKQLSAEGLRSLAPVLGGSTTTSVDKPILEGNRNNSNNGQLLRVYVPLIFDDIHVVGTAEISIQLSSLNAEIFRSQALVLGAVTAIILLAFITLYIIIRQASLTLVSQDKQLRLDIQKEQEYSNLKSEFITLASHQLRTPATTILWSLEELHEIIESKLSSEQKDLANSAQIAAKTLVAIVNNLLIVTDIKPDYFSYETKNYLLKDLILEVLDKNKQNLAVKKQKIVFQSGSGGPEVNLKRSALSLVIEAIYKNAIDYSPIGSTITVTLASQPTSAQIEVTDSGIGIPQKERDKVFGQFFRASNSIEQKNVGSGLSLYIANKIVTGYGSTLQYTALAKGSKFTLSIPLTRTI